MAGFVIGTIAFALPFVLAATGLGRPRVTLGIGGVLAVAWLLSLAVGRADDERGNALVPLWFLAGLVVLLYVIWCGGLWLGWRLRRMRQARPG
jgi:hypothetical protein